MDNRTNAQKTKIISMLLHTSVESSVKSVEFVSDSTRHELIEAYRRTRRMTESLVASLGAEDQNLQPMPEASPVKWHRAHTSWFFETFVLNHLKKNWRWINSSYCELFNSYYNGIGRQHPRALRALISRPDHAAVTIYRQQIDEAMIQLIDSIEQSQWAECHDRIVLGLHHEQQHQELILTDYKASLPINLLGPGLGLPPKQPNSSASALEWVEFDGGLIEMGVDANDAGFHFDNETPRHQVFLNGAYALASRPVTCKQFQSFIDDGGYQTPNLWLADGWAWVQQNSIQHPLYWQRQDGEWRLQTLAGQRGVSADEPVCHINFYEAAAFAEWSGARLPSEAEWEQAARAYPVDGHFAEQQRYHPEAALCDQDSPALQQLFGSVWEWTSSSYAPYPGFKAAKGALGEYNGKFMANQMVLRGGSCATPPGHIRASYRNFFYPVDRWQFSGVRLARDLG